jgi:peptidoglycan hydrolase-like protein with peptidoglycan-binding domain
MRHEQMSRLVLSVACLALGFIWAHPAFAERRVALVIGNSNYQNAPALSDPRSDAQAMAAMFQKAGFDVVSAETDVGNLQFKQAIAQFEAEAGSSDIAVVYYSGYGIDVGGINYLVPVDAKFASDRDAGAAAIALDSLAKSVDRAKRLRLVILDASRGDPFAPVVRQQQTAASQVADRGLAEPEPAPGALIAYAAIAGSQAEDGDAAHSTYTTALLRNLFTPGLDIRLAFGRVLVDVLKKTNKRQNPLVYGSLGGGNIALVPAPADRPALDLEGEKIDYGVVEQIGAARAWEVFLVQHPTGFYSTVARAQLRVAEAQPPKPPPASPPLPGPSAEDQAAREKAEQLAALDRAAPAAVSPGRLPDVNSPERVALAQRELIRLGCFSSAPDGSLNAATKAAVRLYQSTRGENPTGEAAITDDFIAELEKQTARVCPLVCPDGKIAEGEHCVAVGKSPAVASRGAAKPSPSKREQKPAPTPRIPEQASSGSKRIGVTVGVGF